MTHEQWRGCTLCWKVVGDAELIHAYMCGVIFRVVGMTAMAT